MDKEDTNKIACDCTHREECKRKAIQLIEQIEDQYRYINRQTTILDIISIATLIAIWVTIIIVVLR